MKDRIQLHFYGAAGEVTGSASVLSFTNRKGQLTRVLVDCGLFQGAKTDRQKNREAVSYDPETLDAVVVTHAHLDHSGLLPKLGRQYAGHIYCTPGTQDLLKVMLLDAAKLQEEDAEFANRTGYSNHKPAEPLYTIEHAKKVLKQLKPIAMLDWFTLTPEIKFRFHRTGHIVGSAAIEFAFEESNERFTIGMSGDLGHDRHTTLRGPDPLFACDALVLESTYGDRPAVGTENNVDAHLTEIINRITEDSGVLVIPSFAVGRAQELIYRIRRLEDQKLIEPIPVILDSPMSEDATVIYLEHPEEFRRDSSLSLNRKNFFPKKFEIVKNPQQSYENCERRGPLIVISASGMLQGGRVLHHLKGRLNSSKNAVLFVGYQAEGTKGHFLQSKPSELRIHHIPIPVLASIETMHGLSGHADQDELVAWVARAEKRPKKVILNHGTTHAMKSLQARIQGELGIVVATVLAPGPVKLA
jgi:metallo-beta-lactamase family protein